MYELLLPLINTTNITLPTNVSSIPGLMSWANTASNSTYGWGILLATFSIITFGLTVKGYDVLDSITAAGFAGIIISLILQFMNIINNTAVFVFAVVTIVGFLLILAKGVTSVY